MLFAHTQRVAHSYWPAPWIQQTINRVRERGVASLADLAEERPQWDASKRMILGEALAELRNTNHHGSPSPAKRTSHARFSTNTPTPKALVREAMNRAAGRRVQDRRDEQAAVEASWRERALNAEDAVRTANAEILAQREQSGDLLGQIKDLQTRGPTRTSSGSPPTALH